MTRAAIVQALREVAQLLELKGESPFRVRAYENGARLLEGLVEEPATLVSDGRLREVPGIGPGLAANVDEIVGTGRLSLLEELRAAFPPGLPDLLRVPGLGARKIRQLHRHLGIASLEDLEKAGRDGRVAGLTGFGAKSVANLLRSLEGLRRYAGRHLIGESLARAEALLAPVRADPRILRAEIAGSARRRCETVGHLDFVCAVEASRRPELLGLWRGLPGFEGVLAEGEAKVSVVLSGGWQADVWMVEAGEFASAWLHFTGSRAHLEELRALAHERGMDLAAPGLREGERSLRARDEEEIYRLLGLSFIPPEMREGRGEVATAATGSIPELLRLEDLRGTLHVHTDWSDGTASLAVMAAAARSRGWEYLGIADHSRSAAYAGGLDAGRLRSQWAEIEHLNSGWADFRLLRGTECDILADGSLDFDDETLVGCDFVVASVHSHFHLDREAMTRRLVRAVSHPAVTFLGHPTGRLLLAREAYEVDLDAVLAAAAAHGVIVELNASAPRLDLDWRELRGWVARGLPTSIHPDAHSPAGLSEVELGVGIARKAGLCREEVLNTQPLAQMEEYLRARRRRALSLLRP